MGMSIDEAIEHGKEQLEIFGGEHKEFIETSIEIMRKYQMFQAKYAERLKADMVAMLEELKEQLREIHEDYFETEHFDEAYGVSVSMDEIQQKINRLKEDT